MWITWKHQDTDLSWPLTFEQKVDLFYEQALGWQLHIADLVANGGITFGEGKTVSSIRHSGFAVLQICLSYFETIGHYAGKPNGSEAAFRVGVLEVFPHLAKEKTAVRTARVELGQPPEAVAYDPRSRRIVISPERLPRVLKAHLERFRTALMDTRNRELRARFEERFDKDCGAA